MKVLITGAGMIGASLAALATEHGHRVALLDVAPESDFVQRTAGPGTTVHPCDVTDGAAVAEIVEEVHPDAIVHSAALIGTKVDHVPHLGIAVNVVGAASVLEAARRTGVRRVTMISSLAVYDWPSLRADAPVPETGPLGPRSLYGGSKLAAEEVARTFVRRNELDVSILRLAGTYGRGLFRGGSVIGFLVSEAVRLALDEHRLVVPVGLGSREYLHAVDAARAILRDLETPLSGQRTLNIGSGRVHSRERFAAELRRALRDIVDLPPAPPRRIGRAASKDATPPLDIRRAHRAIGYRPTIDLCTGLNLLARDMAAAPRPVA